MKLFRLKTLFDNYCLVCISRHRNGIFLFVVSFFSLTSTGCFSFIDSPQVDLDIVLFEPPVAFGLTDASGNQLGFATPVNEQVLVAPDHLLQTGESLYFQNSLIEVLARDFRHDLFFFEVEGLAFSSVPTWSHTPPGVGQTLAWNSGAIQNQAAVFSARADFLLGTAVIEDTMQLSTLIDPGNSGKPLYDPKNNKTYGMLIASDRLKGVSYFIRSDEILTLAEDYLNITP